MQFFADIKEAEEKMKKMQENMKKKYTCDRSTTATRLEDLLQDALVGISCISLVNHSAHRVFSSSVDSYIGPFLSG